MKMVKLMKPCRWADCCHCASGRRWETWRSHISSDWSLLKNINALNVSELRNAALRSHCKELSFLFFTFASSYVALHAHHWGTKKSDHFLFPDIQRLKICLLRCTYAVVLGPSLCLCWGGDTVDAPKRCELELTSFHPLPAVTFWHGSGKWKKKKRQKKKLNRQSGTILIIPTF